MEGWERRDKMEPVWGCHTVCDSGEERCSGVHKKKKEATSALKCCKWRQTLVVRQRDSYTNATESHEKGWSEEIRIELSSYYKRTQNHLIELTRGSLWGKKKGQRRRKLWQYFSSHFLNESNSEENVFSFPSVLTFFFQMCIKPNIYSSFQKDNWQLFKSEGELFWLWEVPFCTGDVIWSQDLCSSDWTENHSVSVHFQLSCLIWRHCGEESYCSPPLGGMLNFAEPLWCSVHKEGLSKRCGDNWNHWTIGYPVT